LQFALDTAQHQKYTNAWRKAIGYGQDYTKLSKEFLLKTAKEIYEDAPELYAILEASLK
jgi:hypothetical protein